MVVSTLVTIDSILTIVARLAPLAQQALANGQTSVPADQVQAIIDQAVTLRNDALSKLDQDIAAASAATTPKAGP